MEYEQKDAPVTTIELVSSDGGFTARIESLLPKDVNPENVSWANSDRTQIEETFAHLFGLMRTFDGKRIVVERRG